MTVARLWGSATWAVVRRDAQNFFSYRTLFVSQLFAAIFNVLIFYYVSRLLEVSAVGDSDSYFAFVVVGIAIMQVLMSTLGVGPTAVRQELVAGTFERFLVSPFGPVNGILSMLIFPLLTSVVLGTTSVLASATFFGLDLEPTAVFAPAVAVLASLAFLPFALLFASTVMAFKQAITGSQFIIAGMAIVGGLYFPVALLPGWAEWLSNVQPFTPAADVLRHLLVDTPLRESMALSLFKLAAFAAVLLPLSAWVLTRSVQFGKRRGTIIEY